MPAPMVSCVIQDLEGLVVFMQTWYCLMLCVQISLRADILFSAVCAESLFSRYLYAKCPYYLVRYMQSDGRRLGGRPRRSRSLWSRETSSTGEVRMALQAASSGLSGRAVMLHTKQ